VTSAPTPKVADAADLALLRTYEPVVRYTEGELFFPAAIEGYLAACDLLVGSSERDRHEITPVGELTPDGLATHTAPPGETLYLRLVQHPLNGIELARWRLRPDRPHFSAPGRLARVGLFARLVDAGFTASLLLRGTVPGGTAAAAQVKYAAARDADPRFVYYGRVVRRDGWIVLHYLFFYFMNDYRSTFAGVNDHEADWEQVFVYLEDRPGDPRPVWIAAAAHDYVGDDLRRRWDDPLLEKSGDHPVVNAGAGSHATYFERGEYLTTVPLPGIQGLQGFLEALRSFWRDALRQPDPGNLSARLTGALSVPFIDYARGDGHVVGPTGADGSGQWSPVVIADDTPWVDGYRGLFGLDTYDRFAGERAPAGPKYGRSGTVRMSWHDPLGFAGLDKVAPPFRQPDELRARIASREARIVELDTEIQALAAAVPGLDLEVRALAEDGAMAGLHQRRAGDLAREAHALQSLRAERSGVMDTLVGLRRELAAVEAGDFGSPTAHLRHAHHPVPPETVRYGRIVEFWSAVSVSLMLVVIAAIGWFGLAPWWVALLIGVGGYVVLESAFRRRLTLLTLRVVLVLAIIGAIVLVWELRLLLIVGALVGLALVVFSDNLREIRSR
jgi:hypothetical protein